nr:serine/threonine-protein kinase [Actinomadura sp. J1-007]
MSFPPTVGRYRIDRVLGSGAFASVWLGHDDALDAQVAIKVLSGSLIDDLDVRNRFLEEARILRRADSERLVRVHDIGELPDGRPYFVMSYADRGTLADRMRERPLPVNEALALAEETAHGVEVINTLGVIHRDLKPSNVLFQSTADGGEKVLIADLGLAKALAHASGAFTLPVGTPGYMSPEQARFGGGLDVRADVYGLGALTYHMLTGRAPGPAPVKSPPSALREGLSPAFDQVILRALEVEREKRWPTAEAFAEALATLRPTGVPGAAGAGAAAGAAAGATAAGAAAAGAGFAPPPETEADIDPDATMHDRFRQPAPPSAPAQGQGGGGYEQPGGVQGPGGTEVSGHEPYGQEQMPAGAQTQLDQPIERLPPDDDVRTSEMHVPPGQDRRPAAGEDATIVDHPGGAGGARFGQAEPPTDPDDGRTVSLPPSGYSASPGGGSGGGGGGEEGKTTVFPMQPPGGGGGSGQPQGPGYTQGPGPGQPYGGGHGQQGPPPPTGFQAAPPAQGGGQKGARGGFLAKLKGGGGSGGGSGGTGGGPSPARGQGPAAGGPKKFLTPLIITVVVLAVAVVGGLALGTLFSDGDDGGGAARRSRPSPRTSPRSPTRAARSRCRRRGRGPASRSRRGCRRRSGSRTPGPGRCSARPPTSSRSRGTARAPASSSA